jgi:hypothetical protein
MSEISRLKTNTFWAARDAKDAGLISEKRFQEMTDGAVSLFDVNAAKDTMKLLESLPYFTLEEEGISLRLQSAVFAQHNEQFIRSSLFETPKEMIVKAVDLSMAAGRAVKGSIEDFAQHFQK